MDIKICNLSFKYDKKAKINTLDSINLEIKTGTVNVLLGLNGSGKTTLIKLLAGLEKPTNGYIQYGDNNLKDIKIRDRAKIFSYVSQKSNVSGDIPVRQYLSYGTTNSIAFYESPGKEEMARVDNVASQFKIESLLDKNLNELSGGELQIVMIACAIIQNTEILLLDEPTSALDMKNQHLVLSTLKKITQQEGKTIIFSSHNPNHALFLKSNVVILNKGVLYNQGPSNKTIKVENLKEIYGDSICKSKELEYGEISYR